MKRYIIYLLLLCAGWQGLSARVLQDDGKPIVDIVCSAGGEVSDAASGRPVYCGSVRPATYYHAAAKRWISKFTGKTECFYRIDYDEALRTALQGSYSFEVVYKAYDLDNETAVLSSQQYGGMGIEHIDGKICFLAHWGGDYRTVSASQPMERGVFYHVIGVMDRVSNELRLYVDGKKEQTLHVEGELVFPQAEQQWIGIGGDMNSETSSVQYPLNGEMAAARIYDYAIDDAGAALRFEEFSFTSGEVEAPEADWVDLKFEADGTIRNQAKPELGVMIGANAPAVGYHPVYGGMAASFSGSETCYYGIDFSQHADMKDMLCQEFSVETVFQPDQAGGAQALVSWQQYGGAGLELHGNELIYYAYVNGTYHTLSAATPIEPDQLYHVVASYSKEQGELRIYVNGKIDGVQHVSGDLTLPSEEVAQWIAIGGDASPEAQVVQYPFKGVLARVRIYGSALSDEQVAALYDLTDHSAEIKEGVYAIRSNAAQPDAASGAPYLTGLYCNRPGALGCVQSDSVDLGMVWKIVKSPDETGGYYLKNSATGQYLQSAANGKCGQQPAAVRFYAYSNGTYAIRCDGFLFAEDEAITTGYGDEQSGAAWCLTALAEADLERYAARTMEQVREWYRPGTRYDEHAPNPELEQALTQQPGEAACQALVQALYVPDVQKLRVLQYNTWNNGGMVSGGEQGIFSTIEQTHPDIVLLQEVRSQDFIDRVIAYFRERGITYYGRSMNISTAILSRFPIDSIRSSEELGSGSYAFAKACLSIQNREFAFYSVHLDWKHLAYYNVRGFDGNSDTCPYAELGYIPESADEVLQENRQSRRPQEIEALIADMQKETAKGRYVIFGGDFNEPSYLDWQENTKDLRDHHQLVIPWDCSYRLSQAGFKDAYRTLYPNAVTHPGFTCNAGNAWAEAEDYTWAYGVDDRERIDQTYYYPADGIQLTAAMIVGPKADFYDREIRYEPTADSIFTPEGVWASDHKAVLTEYAVAVQVPMTFNDTRMDAGTYYITTAGKLPLAAPYVSVGNEAICPSENTESGCKPTRWLWDGTYLSTLQGDNGNVRYLTRSGELSSNPEPCRAFSLQVGRPERVALAFSPESDFGGYYLYADSTGQYATVQLENPALSGQESHVFSMEFWRVASDVRTDSLYERVAFVEDESSPCPDYRARSVQWSGHFVKGQWRAVFLPAAACVRFAAPGGTWQVMTYNADEQTFTPWVGETADTAMILPAGAYLMRSAESDADATFTCDSVCFTSAGAGEIGLTGTGQAGRLTVSGYTLNDDATRFVYHQAVPVGPFEAYIAWPDSLGEPVDYIPVPGCPTGLGRETALQAQQVRISVSADRRIVVSGASEYAVYTLSGTLVPHRNACLEPGVYVVRTVSPVQVSRKVIVP